MYIVTADQVGSRSAPDAVGDVLTLIKSVGHRRLARAPERTVGDEVQVATEDARCLLELILELTRRGRWSVGCGIGTVELPLPRSIRAARGSAFIAARDAIDQAKKRPTRFALRGSRPAEEIADAQACIDLLLALRARRTDEGWEVFDLISQGHSQAVISELLHITGQAVSLRVRAAQISLEVDAVPALVRALERAEAEAVSAE